MILILFTGNIGFSASLSQTIPMSVFFYCVVFGFCFYTIQIQIMTECASFFRSTGEKAHQGEFITLELLPKWEISVAARPLLHHV